MRCRFFSGWRRCSPSGLRWKKALSSPGIGRWPDFSLGSGFFPNTPTHLSLFRLCWCWPWRPGSGTNSSIPDFIYCLAYSLFARCRRSCGTHSTPGSRLRICDRAAVSSMALACTLSKLLRLLANIFSSTRHFFSWDWRGALSEAGNG